ncbi:heavy metal translocating P-type ATPase [Paludibacterium purpuratum]|uniref:P-type Zn(2+) transporter n=1 Tax=Paludibacterium purpuratum TaxID=1144873 RepID=A0A4R7BCC2_9NEIS|nr:heavy metal translocating P-type ATPase [Paludibacterium purpuratum]TDR82710.1 Cd2+/Zn2+-exporting ATPase [Paludibacterium purpuratum]
MSESTTHQQRCGCHGHGCTETVSAHEHQQEHEAHHEHEHEHEHEHSHEHAHQAGACCGGTDGGVLKARLSDKAGAESTRLRIQAMDCPTEARLIEKALAGVPGVTELHFDFFERVLTVEHERLESQRLIDAIAHVGMRAEPLSAGAASEPAASTRHGGQGWFALSGVAAFTAEGVAWGMHDQHPLVVLLAVLSIACGGLPTLKKGWIALRSRVLNIHFLMALAVSGALLIGQWPEAAMVLFLFGLAEKLEAMSLSRVGRAVRELMSLAPATAWVRAGDDWREVAVAEVAVGDKLRVRPGERVPLDGDIVVGRSDFNEAPITGESLPRDKGEGEPVFAGSINGQGMVEIVARAPADGSVLARIIDSVRDAQASKAPTQRFIDRFARIYTPAVVLLAVAAAILLPLFGLMPARTAFYQSLVLLVIACPCAMVIATPVTLVSSLAAAARHGLLIKGGEALETAARVRAVAFDKTGTLTTGQTEVVRILPLAECDEVEVLRLAAALDAHSTHPLARALLSAAGARQLDLPPAEQLREQAGLGVSGMIAGRQLSLGSQRMARDAGAWGPALQQSLDEIELQGQAALLLLEGSRALGAIAVADRVRPEAAAAVSRLAALGVHAVILSGDNQRVVDSLGRVTGIDDAQGALLPEDKLTQIERLQARYGVVAMVGDGVNDAPALARADLGVAMGAASDTALETASVALMDDRLAKLPQMLSLAHRTMRVLRFNLGLALAIKLVFFALALSGLATLWMAVFADVGASLIVVGNGLRLARHKP